MLMVQKIVLTFCAFFLAFSSDADLYIFAIISLKPKSIRFQKNCRELLDKSIVSKKE